MLALAEGAVARGHHVAVAYSPRREDALFRAGRAALPAIDWVAVPLRRAPHPTDLPAVLAVRRLALDGAFDIIHGHSSKGGMIARLAALRTACAAVYTPHAISTLDPTLDRAKRWLYAAGERALAPLGAAIVAVSSAERAHIVGLGIDPDKVVLIPNAVDPPNLADRGQARALIGLGPRDVAIGFVGRLTRQKAIDLMIEGFAAVHRQLPDTRLVVVGDGELEASARARAMTSGCAAQIHWMGAIEARAVMCGFDMLALPSRYEGASYVALEAAAAALPVVATDVGGVRDAVVDGETGLIVPPEDPMRLTEALRRLAGDSDLRAGFAAAAAARIRPGGVDRLIEANLAPLRAAARRSSWRAALGCVSGRSRDHAYLRRVRRSRRPRASSPASTYTSKKDAVKTNESMIRSTRKPVHTTTKPL